MINYYVLLNIHISPVNLASVTIAIRTQIGDNRKGYITVTGVHGVMESYRNESVREAHRGAWLTVPDGMPLVYIGRMYGHKEIDRCYGPDLMEAVMQASVTHGWRHFFYGGQEGRAQELKAAMEDRFPGVHIVGTFTPPFRPLNEAERNELISQVRELQPDIVWVGLSTPKQELFMHEYLPLLDTKIMIGVGAAFDFHTGHIKSAPRWMQRCAMEWAYRVYQEPRRLWRRYFVNNPLFIWNFALQLLKLKRFN